MTWFLMDCARTSFWRGSLVLALSALALGAARPVTAQTPASAPSTEARIADLERQLAELKQKLAEAVQAGQDSVANFLVLLASLVCVCILAASGKFLQRQF